MIGLDVTITPIGRYADSGARQYYFDGPLRDALMILKIYKEHCGNDWNQVEIGITEVFELPSDYAEQLEVLGEFTFPRANLRELIR